MGNKKEIFKDQISSLLLDIQELQENIASETRHLDNRFLRDEARKKIETYKMILEQKIKLVDMLTR